MNLRLLITPYCNRNCDECCNLNFDLNALPSIEQADEFAQFDAISITGGEPMLVYDKLRETLMYIIEYGDFKGDIFLYTAMPEHPDLEKLLNRCNLVITIHDRKALVDVIDFYYSLDHFGGEYHSVRVKLAEKVHQYYNLLEKEVYGWEVEKFDWIDDCPLPDGEVFMRI